MTVPFGLGFVAAVDGMQIRGLFRTSGMGVGKEQQAVSDAVDAVLLWRDRGVVENGRSETSQSRGSPLTAVTQRRGRSSR